MGKKATIITSVAALALVGGGVAAAVVIAQQDNTRRVEKAQRLESFSEDALRVGWVRLSTFLQDKRKGGELITVATNQQEANFGKYRDQVYDVLANSPIDPSNPKGVKFGDYITNTTETFKQEGANLTFQIKPSMVRNGRLSPLNLDEKYIQQWSDANGSYITFNNLPLSSPKDYFSMGGDVYQGNGIVMGLTKKGLEEPHIIIPDGTRKISPYAFYNNTTIEKLVIADSVEEIGNSMFLQENDNGPNSKLSYAKLSKRCKVIPDVAFRFNENLREVFIPDGVEEIKSAAFHTVPFGGELKLPKSLWKIEASAFKMWDGKDENLTTLTLSSTSMSATDNGSSPFYGRLKLKRINLLVTTPSALNYSNQAWFTGSVTPGMPTSNAIIYLPNEQMQQQFQKNNYYTLQSQKVIVDPTILDL